MKNLRKDATLGIILLVAWLVIKLLFRGSGILLWLLGAVGLVLLVIGLLPENLHAKAMQDWDRLRGSIKK